MTTTRLYRNGNSQAVRIPAELAYERSDQELESLAHERVLLSPNQQRLSRLQGSGQNHCETD